MSTSVAPPLVPQPKQRDLKGQVAIVTGAASGMGAAVSRRLDGRGAKVVVADQDEANGRKVAASLKNGGSFFKVDLSEMPEIEKLWNYALERYGKVDIVISNAGIANGDYHFEHPTQPNSTGWLKMFHVNLAAPIYMAQLAIRHWQKTSHPGVITNTASMAAVWRGTNAPVYGATKAGVYHLSRSIGRLPGIRCNAILPAGVITPLWESLHDIPKVGNDEKGWEQMRKDSSFLTPEDIADAMVMTIDDTTLTGCGLQVHGDGIIDILGKSWDKPERRFRGPGPRTRASL